MRLYRRDLGLLVSGRIVELVTVKGLEVSRDVAEPVVNGTLKPIFSIRALYDGEPGRGGVQALTCFVGTVVDGSLGDVGSKISPFFNLGLTKATPVTTLFWPQAGVLVALTMTFPAHSTVLKTGRRCIGVLAVRVVVRLYLVSSEHMV